MGDKRQGVRAQEWAETMRSTAQDLIDDGVNGPAEMARRLNADGHLTRFKKSWSVGTVARSSTVWDCASTTAR
jgi:hypothetical protein